MVAYQRKYYADFDEFVHWLPQEWRDKLPSEPNEVEIKQLADKKLEFSQAYEKQYFSCWNRSTYSPPTEANVYQKLLNFVGKCAQDGNAELIVLAKEFIREALPFNRKALIYELMIFSNRNIWISPNQQLETEDHAELLQFCKTNLQYDDCLFLYLQSFGRLPEPVAIDIGLFLFDAVGKNYWNNQEALLYYKEQRNKSGYLFDGVERNAYCWLFYLICHRYPHKSAFMQRDILLPHLIKTNNERASSFFEGKSRPYEKFYFKAAQLCIEFDNPRLLKTILQCYGQNLSTREILTLHKMDIKYGFVLRTILAGDMVDPFKKIGILVSRVLFKVRPSKVLQQESVNPNLKSVKHARL